MAYTIKPSKKTAEFCSYIKVANELPPLDITGYTVDGKPISTRSLSMEEIAEYLHRTGYWEDK